MAERFASERAPLERLLLVSSGTSSLSVAICNVPSDREALLVSLIGSTGALRSDVEGGVPTNYFETLERRVDEARPTALFVTGVGNTGEYRQWLNRNRERWKALFAGPVIFWMSAAVAAASARGAPDFWSWVSHQFDFTSTDEPAIAAAGSSEDREEGLSLWSGRSKTAKLERLRELRGRLGELEDGRCDDPTIVAVVESWWSERLAMLESLGRDNEMIADADTLLDGLSVRDGFRCQLLLLRSRSLARRGHLGASERDLRNAESLAERLDEATTLATVRGQIADVLFRRGDLDEALRIRREEESVHERLGDVRSLAITRGKVADILFRCGNLDEALRIRREQEEPVYERLGDVRSLAITRGKVADILFKRGDLDEALRLWREQLPVLERLHERPTIEIVRERIAALERRLGGPTAAVR